MLCSAQNGTKACQNIEATLATAKPASASAAASRHDARRTQKLAATEAMVVPPMSSADTIPASASVKRRSATAASTNCGSSRNVAIATTLCATPAMTARRSTERNGAKSTAPAKLVTWTPACAQHDTRLRGGWGRGRGDSESSSIAYVTPPCRYNFPIFSTNQGSPNAVHAIRETVLAQDSPNPADSRRRRSG